MMRRLMVGVMTALACGGGLPGPGAVWAGPASEELSPLQLARMLNQAFVEVARNVSPAVVVIQVAHREDYPASFQDDHPFWENLPPDLRKQLEEQFREYRQRQPGRPGTEGPAYQSQGSGVVIRKDGYILTNRHVVEGAEKIKVRLQDGTEYTAEVRGEDAQSDLAVLKIEASNLTEARLGDSSQFQVGEFAIAIGAPYDLDYSITFGHVSAKGRSQLINDRAMDQDFIQTDANINPGNSGGPLVNIEGEVMGINTLIRGLRSGIGFAIPINLAMEVADKLISEGRYVRAWLGIGILALKSHQEYRTLVTGVGDGVVVTLIRPDGPAFKSDLQPNDIITTVDGKPVSNEVELKAAIRSKAIGDEVVLQVHRLNQNLKGRDLTVRLKVAAWPEELFPVVELRQPLERDPTTTLGVRVELLTKSLAERFGILVIPGVVITEVLGGSLAESKGLLPGDVITEINQIPVATPKQMREALKTADLSKGVIINFVRQGVSQFEVFRKAGTN